MSTKSEQELRNKNANKLLSKLYDWYEKLPEDNLVTWWKVTPTELVIFITHEIELAKIESKIETMQTINSNWFLQGTDWVGYFNSYLDELQARKQELME